MFSVPQTAGRPLVIEGAGGVLVPLNETHCMVDLIERLQCETVVVSKHYLGSINHTLLTVEALERRGIEILGLVFNGEENADTESLILSKTLSKTGVPLLGRIRWEPRITPGVIKRYADELTPALARHRRTSAELTSRSRQE